MMGKASNKRNSIQVESEGKLYSLKVIAHITGLKYHYVWTKIIKNKEPLPMFLLKEFEQFAFKVRLDKWKVEKEQKKEAKKQSADSKPSKSPSDSESFNSKPSDSKSFDPLESELLIEAVRKLTQKETARRTFKDKIRISHQGKEDPFLDAILEYLETLDNDNRRIEACYNIIKISKGIAADLQIKGSLH